MILGVILIIPILFSIFYSQFTSFLRLAKTQMYSPLCHISISWGFFCRHTTKSFRINQPASSILKAQAQISTQRETQGSFLNFTITPECIWRKWNVFPTARDQDFFLIVLEIFRLGETTSVKQRAINTLNEQTLAPEAHLLICFSFSWRIPFMNETWHQPKSLYVIQPLEWGSNNWSLPSLPTKYQWAKSL